MAEREVSYALRVTSDSRSGGVFDDMAKKAKVAEEAANRAGKAVGNVGKGGAFGDMGSGGAAGASGGAGGGGAKAGPSAFSALEIGAFKAFAAMQLLSASLKSVTEGANKYASANASVAQKQEGLIQSVPVIGSVITGAKDLHHAFSGITESMNAAALAAGRFDAAVQADAAADDKLSARIDAARLAEVRRNATGRIATMVAGNPQLQAVLANEKTGSQSAAILAAQRDSMMASQIHRVTAKDQSALLREQEQATADRWKSGLAVEEAKKLGGVMVGDGKGTAVDEQLLEAQLKHASDLKAEKIAINRLADADARFITTAVEKEQKRIDLTRAGVELARTRMGLLKEELGTAEGMAGAFGKLNANERATVADSLKRLKAGGLDSSSQFDRDLIAKGGFGKVLDEAAQKTGLASPAFREAMAAAGMKTVDAIRKEMIELKTQVNINVQMDEAKLAAILLPMVEKSVREMKVTFEKFAENEKAQQRQAAAMTKP